MKLIKNKRIPFKDFKAIMLFGVVFYKGAPLTQEQWNHEYCHMKQYQEVTLTSIVPLVFISAIFSWYWLILIPFLYYVIYILEWLIRLPFYGGGTNAYFRISFEQDAYFTQDKLLTWCGKPYKISFTWVKYLFKK